MCVSWRSAGDPEDGITKVNILSLCQTLRGEAEHAVTLTCLTEGAGEPWLAEARAGVVLACAAVLTQAAVLTPEAVCAFWTPVLTGGAGVARRTHTGARHSVAGAAVVTEALVLAVDSPTVNRAH